MFLNSHALSGIAAWQKKIEEDLERVQKSAVRIIVGKDIKNYDDALIKADLDSLKDRRTELCMKFARKCGKNNKSKEMFPLRQKIHEMETREEEKYEVQHANTERLKNSAIPYMQRLMNEYEQQNFKKEEHSRIRMPG